jgi:hypothetical protein
MSYQYVPIAPLPEAIDGERWSIDSSSQARVDLGKREMFVPLSDSAEDHFVRLHEMAHAKWTPKKSPAKEAEKIGVAPDLLQSCEDYRMHALLSERMRMQMRLVGHMTEGEIEAMLLRLVNQPDVISPLVKMALSIHRTGDWLRLKKVIRQLAGIPLEYDEDGKAEPAPPSPLNDEQKKVLRYAGTEAQKILEESHSVIHPTRGPRNYPKWKDMLRMAKFVHDRIAMTPPRPNPDSAVNKEETERLDRDTRMVREELHKTRHEIEFGTADVRSVALTHPVKEAQVGRRERAHDSGTVPRFMHRYNIDGRIFGRRRKAPGGTVLVDASGSMSLSMEDIERIIAAAPCATVAMYSGRKDTGSITVIARGGHRADVKAIERVRAQVGGGNIIDGPALTWLGKQAEPRLWVCDGYITGCNDSSSAALTTSAFATARRIKAKRFINLSSAVTAFEEMRAGKRVVGAAEPGR